MPTPTTYTYSLSNDFPGGQINSSALEIAINESTIVTPLSSIDQSGDVISINFSDTLSTADKNTLDGNQTHPAGGLIASTPTRPFIDNNLREIVLGYFPQVSMSSTQDQPFFITTKPYIISRIVAYNASTAIMAFGGIYTQRNKTGSIYVPATQSYAALSDSNKFLNLTLNPVVTLNVQRKQELYFSLTMGQMSAATIDLLVYGQDMSTILS